MADLTPEAAAALARADVCINIALNGTEQGSPEERETTAQVGVLEAIRALCYEIAAHREATFMRLTDIESTLYSKLKG